MRKTKGTEAKLLPGLRIACFDSIFSRQRRFLLAILLLAFTIIFLLQKPAKRVPLPPMDVVNTDDTWVSIVITLRNDKYGGKEGFKRFQRFFDSIASQAKKHNVKVEMIIVDWNPPANARPLREAFEWPKTGIKKLKIITVPASFHNSFPHSESRGMYEFIAKNIGIGRAKGPWVLATNADNVWSDEMWQKLAKPNELDPHAYYFIKRVNTQNFVPEGSTPEQVLSFLEKEPRNPPIVTWAQIHLKSFTQIFRDMFLSLSLRASLNQPYTQACGDFTLMRKEIFEYINGYDEALYSTYMHWDSVLLCKAHALGLKQVIWEAPIRMFHMYHKKNLWNKSYKKIQTKHSFMLQGCLAAINNQDPWYFGVLPDWSYSSQDFETFMLDEKPEL